MGERANPRQCCPSTAYSSKTFNLTSPKYLPDNSQISVLLHNGPRNFIVTSPPRALYGLSTNLRKIRKVEFSKRKPVFSMRFLVVVRFANLVEQTVDSQASAACECYYSIGRQSKNLYIFSNRLRRKLPSYDQFAPDLGHL